MLELLYALCAAHEIVGIDLVEVAPDYDHGGTTAILAAQLLLNLIGRVFHHDLRRETDRSGVLARSVGPVSEAERHAGG